MSRPHYTTEIRVLLCEACGAPIESTPRGGHVACAYCKAQNVVRHRPKESAFAPPSVPIDENERWRRLRMQDGKAMVPPQALLYLVQGSSLHPAKIEEAFHIYRGTRKEVTTTHSPEAAERLYFLTLMLNTHLTLTHDDVRRRAILETSLETLNLPRHEQVIRCMLATAAAKEGDLASAEDWIAPCDPMSQELEADTAWRCARAFLDTAKGQPRAVIHVLGHLDDQVPIADAWDPTAAVFRANALERLGDLQGAVTALRSRMGKENHHGRATMQKVIEGNPQLSLCPQSFQMALAGHTQTAAGTASRGADGGVGSIFYFVGIGITLLGVVIALIVLGASAVPALSSGHGIEAIFGGVFGAGITCITTVPLGLIFAGVGYMLRKKAQEAAWLRVNGIQAQGTVRGSSPTGTVINGVPIMRVEVEVMHPNAAPYLASFKQLLTPGLSMQLQPGSLVPIRIHPQDPSQIILESA